MSGQQRYQLNALKARGWMQTAHMVHNERGSVILSMGGASRGLHAYFTITREGRVIVS